MISYTSDISSDAEPDAAAMAPTSDRSDDTDADDNDDDSKAAWADDDDDDDDETAPNKESTADTCDDPSTTLFKSTISARTVADIDPDIGADDVADSIADQRLLHIQILQLLQIQYCPILPLHIHLQQAVV